MNELFLALIILIFILLFARYLAILRNHRHTEGFHEGQKSASMNVINEERHEAYERNLDRVLELAGRKDFVTNNNVELLLEVSDATATRYLEELERRGKLRQVGDTGRGVKYELIK